MLVEQRTVIERLSCKLGKDNEDLELQFSAAVAKVVMVILKGIVHNFFIFGQISYFE